MHEQRDSGGWVLLATILGSGMAFLDGTVVNVALPAIQSDLNATVTQLQWVIEAYMLFLAALILVGGSLGDQYGRRKIFGIGISLFTIASAWSGLASSPGQLILARSLQGIGGALLTPGSLAIITAYFSDPGQRAKAIGKWSALTTVVFIIGPVLGGWLVDVGSWRWVFYINIPLAAIVLFVLFKFVPESKDELASAEMDWWGTISATIGLAGISFGLIESANLGLNHPLVVTGVFGGLIFLAIFILVQRFGKHPMMSLDLFSSKTFSGANLLTFFLYGSLGWFSFYLPLNLIQVQGYSAGEFGLAYLPFPIFIGILSPLAGSAAGKIGAKIPLILGPLVVTLGYVLLATTGLGGDYWTTYFPGIAAVGIGFGITAAPLTAAVMGAVNASHSGLASGINNAVARTASLLAIALIGLLAIHAFSTNMDESMDDLNVSGDLRMEMSAQYNRLAEVEVPTGMDQTVSQVLDAAVDASFLESFRLSMLWLAGLGIASAVMALLFVEGKKSDEIASDS